MDNLTLTQQGVASLLEYMDEVDNGNLEFIQYGGDRWSEIRESWLAVVCVAQERLQRLEIEALRVEIRAESERQYQILAGLQTRHRELEDISLLHHSDPATAMRRLAAYRDSSTV